MNFSSLNKAEVLDHFCPPHAFVTHELKLIWLRNLTPEEMICTVNLWQLISL